jgi:hypothetical protein
MAVKIVIKILREIGREIIGYPDEFRELRAGSRAGGLGLDRIHADSRPVRQVDIGRQQDFAFRNFADASHDQLA